jgi:hypothetical protein
LARRQVALASAFAALGLISPALFLSTLLQLTAATLRRLLVFLTGRLTARHLLRGCQGCQ